ncbi:MAG: transporter, partial [Verrucomicrobia bacterium]
SFNTNTGTRSMSGFTGFYFSFVTLSTVGYGDITPVSRIARMLAAMEAMTGLLYVAVLIARLVSLYSTPKSDDS